MSTQQDIYAVSFENRPPMLNKENYVPWSSYLLRYAKSKPNGKLIYNSIMNGPYVKRMILELGTDKSIITRKQSSTGTRIRRVQIRSRKVKPQSNPTNDELTEKKVKQMEADDQAIQIILMGLPEDIYATVDSCETAQEI
ncbi:hypothetical protein Tco_0366052 [Tanacetum coccineum]